MLQAQRLLSIAILAALCLTGIGIVALARFTPVFAEHVERERAKLEATNGLYYFDESYRDEGDYVLVGQLMHDDYSRGGVYFLGSSEMNVALMPWALTPGERRLIHNYSIGDTRHSENRHYVRMLMEDNNLLEAGGENTTVILGLTFQQARIKEGGMYVRDLFRRHGLYTYDRAEGITRVEMPRFERDYILARDEANRFLRIVLHSPSRVRLEPDTRAFMYEHMNGVMAGDWRAIMRDEVADLTATIDYLQARGVRVWALYPPMGSWQDEMPYLATYREMVDPILAARNVRLVDYGDLLPDEEFMDALHARYAGTVKFHREIHALALEALEEMGTQVEEPAAAQARGDHQARF
jgi:hypothetical protein